MATNSPKYRDFFITINQNAPCYERALEITKELNIKLYAYIVHDKDFIVNENGESVLKAVHKHLMIEVKNPVSFKAMQDRFAGAHIEIPKYKKSAYQYLLHNLPNARDKYQYPLADIITNDVSAIKYIIESEDSELFYQNKFLVYIAEGVRTPYQFVKRFGLDAYKQYFKPYNDMLLQLDTDEEMQADLRLIVEGLAGNDDLPF